jgi:hypothetical protein
MMRSTGSEAPKRLHWTPNAFLPMNIERYYDFWNRGI